MKLSEQRAKSHQQICEQIKRDIINYLNFVDIDEIEEVVRRTKAEYEDLN